MNHPQTQLHKYFLHLSLFLCLFASSQPQNGPRSALLERMSLICPIAAALFISKGQRGDNFQKVIGRVMHRQMSKKLHWAHQGRHHFQTLQSLFPGCCSKGYWNYLKGSVSNTTPICTFNTGTKLLLGTFTVGKLLKHTINDLLPGYGCERNHDRGKMFIAKQDIAKPSFKFPFSVKL